MYIYIHYIIIYIYLYIYDRPSMAFVLASLRGSASPDCACASGCGGGEPTVFIAMAAWRYPNSWMIDFMENLSITYWCITGNGWEWGNGIIIDSYCG